MAIKKIHINKLRVGMDIADPVYATKGKKRYLLIAPNTVITNEQQIRRLYANNIEYVNIDTDRGIDTFKTLLEQTSWSETRLKTGEGAASDAMLDRHYSTFVETVTATVGRSLTTRPLIADEHISALLMDIMAYVREYPDILLALIRLHSLNEYTYNHAITTTVLSLSLTKALKFKYTDIKRFGVGSILADLGMTSYPSKMIMRPSGLSRQEIEVIKKHPLYTVEFLKKIGIDDQLIETMILQHHERYDGTGYPNGLKGDEIHTAAKLFSIADVYDAMTSSRPHRQGIPPHMVLNQLMEMSGTLFDPKMVKFFIRHVGLFPVGNLVELTSGNLALVAGQNVKDRLRPLVIVLQTKKKLTTSKKKSEDELDVIVSRGGWELVDLATDNGTHGKIKRGLDHRQLHLNPSYYLDQV